MRSTAVIWTPGVFLCLCIILVCFLCYCESGVTPLTQESPLVLHGLRERNGGKTSRSCRQAKACSAPNTWPSFHPPTPPRILTQPGKLADRQYSHWHSAVCYCTWLWGATGAFILLFLICSHELTCWCSAQRLLLLLILVTGTKL